MTIDEARLYMEKKIANIVNSSPVNAFSKDADAYYLAVKALEELKKKEVENG